MSGFRIVPFSDVPNVQAVVAAAMGRLRSGDRDEVAAIIGPADGAQLADMMVNRLTGPRFVAGDDTLTTIYGVGGWEPLKKGVVEAWIMTTDHFVSGYIQLTRALHRDILPAMADGGIRRIECKSISTNESAHRWLEILGGTRESEHEGYGVNGEDFITYSWRL